MRFDVFLRSDLSDQFADAAERIAAWRKGRRLEGADRQAVAERVRFFEHTTGPPSFRLGGADGTGEYPLLAVDGAFVHFTLAAGTAYEAGDGRPREVGPELPPVVHAAWVPEDEGARHREIDAAFEALAGRSIGEVLERSDYRKLKAKFAGVEATEASLRRGLIRPHAADSGTLGLHLRTTAELGVALRLVESAPAGGIVLADGTLSLPLVGRADAALFHEHLRRLCCTVARERDVVFAALSKSPGLPGIEAVEHVAAEAGGELTGGTGESPRSNAAGADAEHWYLRLPIPGVDDWDFPPTRDLNVPPAGAVSYLVRSHRTTPVLRLDLDRTWWLDQTGGRSAADVYQWERDLFEGLDYFGHDLRAYGYPYPLKAAHDRASLTPPERKALRQRLVDEALRRGVPLQRMRNAALRTGHA